MNQLAIDILNVLEKYGVNESQDQVLMSIANNIDRAILCRDIDACKQCGLCKSTAHKVPGEGPKSSMMIVGEGSGETENATGRPFVGPAGQLLDKILFDASVDRSKIYITNSVKCHPPYNRDPELGELESCARLFLSRELDIVKPTHIIVMGPIAASLFTNNSLASMRGKTIEFKGYPVTFTYHPSHILRKRDAEYTQLYEQVVDDISVVVSDIVEKTGSLDICRKLTPEEEKFLGMK